MRVITNIYTIVSAYYFDLETKIIYFVLLANERKSQRYLCKTWLIAH